MTTVVVNDDKREQFITYINNQIVPELLRLGLTSGDVYRASELLSKEPYKLNVLFNIPLEMRRQYMINTFYPSTSSH